jgi:hypothetical protein
MRPVVTSSAIPGSGSAVRAQRQNAAPLVEPPSAKQAASSLASTTPVHTGAYNVAAAESGLQILLRRAEFLAQEAPFLFIVGSGRSGTTLLRLMMDAHPALAIPPETLFPEELTHIDHRDATAPARTSDLLTSIPNWDDFHISADALRAEINRITPFSLGDAVRCFYRLYALRFGKARWGDKTPNYWRYLNMIETILPEAHFVHIIRDGRAVALSYRTTWNQHDGIEGIRSLAADWSTCIRETRRQGAECCSYMEVNYETLVQSPESVLSAICSFIHLPFCETMLQYHLQAPSRIGELGALRVHRGEGPDLCRSREERMAVHATTFRPPDASRIHSWRSKLSLAEIQCFENTAGDLLSELGYPLIGCEPRPGNSTT